MRWRVLLGAAALVAVTACSGDDSSEEAATTLATEAAPSTDPIDDEEQSGNTVVAATEVPATDVPPTTEPAPTTTQPPVEPFFGDFETAIAQSTEESGGGIRPLLEWDPVDDVDHYGVYVYAPSGETYWAWRGAETSVFVGGATQIREDAPGPSVTEGMAWAVVAYDVDLLPIAASAVRPIAP